MKKRTMYRISLFKETPLTRSHAAWAALYNGGEKSLTLQKLQENFEHEKNITPSLFEKHNSVLSGNKFCIDVVDGEEVVPGIEIEEIEIWEGDHNIPEN